MWPQVERAGAAAVEMDQVRREMAVGVVMVPVSVVRVEGVAARTWRPRAGRRPLKSTRLNAALGASYLSSACTNCLATQSVLLRLSDRHNVLC